MTDTSPADEIRAAAEVLRRPNHKGAFTASSSAAALLRARQPLADWLESLDDIAVSEHGPLPAEYEHALTIARHINQEPT